ncbi:MAG: hypothetical protein HOJ48_13630 [Desulfobacula sp.]|jgi:hypothetical protein|nr:hypothetical protein [Deltaproteobacteria bacterium]MBT6340327.1 hypothetical protein [Desulfobacula sp.]
MKRIRDMFHKIMILCMAFVTIFVSASYADTEIVTIAEGVALIQGDNIVGAKENAKNDALRQALEQGIGMLMDAETILKNDDLMEKIYTHSTGYIKNYTIIKEGEDKSGIYRVTIRAVTKTETLRNTLTHLGLIHQMVDYPRIMILPFPDKGMISLAEAAEAILVQQFTDRHFELVDPAKSKQLHNEAKDLLKVDTINNIAAKIGLQHQAEIVILYSVDTGASEFDGMMETATATMTTRAIVTTTAQILTADNKTLSGLGKTPELAFTKAANSAAQSCAEKLIPSIVSWWDNYTANGLPYIITLKTPPKADRLIILFQQNMESIPGVVSLSERSSGGGITEMMVKYKGKSTDLKRAVLSIMFKHASFKDLYTVIIKGRFMVFSIK